MKFKMLVVIIMFASLVFSIESFGYYNNRLSVEAKNYVLQLPQNLGQASYINKDYSIMLLPSIKINGKVITIVPPLQQNLLSKPKSMLNLKVISEKQGVMINEKVRIEEDKISSEIILKNEAQGDKKVSLYFPISSNSKKTIFIADNYKNNSHYIVLTNPNLEGNSLGISFSDQTNTINQKNTLINTSAYGISSREMLLKKGQSYRFKIIYYPFNLQAKTRNTYPSEEAIYLESTYIRTTGKINLNNSNSADPITSILKALDSKQKTGDGSFLIEHDVILGKFSDSLDFAMYFKKAAEEEGIPVKLVIGKKGNKKYAWAEVYFGGWKEVDAFKGTRTFPKGWRVIFSEPPLKLVSMKAKGNKVRNLYEATKWLKKTQENNFLLYLVFLIILTITITAFINLKSGVIEKRFKKTEIRKQELEGEYEILKTDKIEKEFINEILKEVINQHGKVDLSQLSNKFHYSKELISFAIAYLIDNKYIRSTSQSKQASNKKTSLKQKITVSGITIAALVLIIYLLIT